ncbi:rod-binding protein [Thermovorax subterraneus]|nr:rod-binding protein [Thermovorax subterraneus]
MIEPLNFYSPSGSAEARKAELKRACEQFEAIFLKYLLKEMRKTVPNGGLFDNSLSYNIFQSLYDDALSEEISKNNGMGIAEELYKQLSKYA